MAKSAIANLTYTARFNSNLSQAEVAKKMGWKSPQSVSNIERGVSPCPLHYLRHLQDMGMARKEEIIDCFLMDAEKQIESWLNLPLKDLEKLNDF